MTASKGQKLLTAGAALAIAETVVPLAHGGTVGFIVGLAAAGAAYMYADDLASLVGREFPSLPTARTERAPGQHSLFYRLLNGKSTRGESPVSEAGNDTFLADESAAVEDIPDDCLDLGQELRPHVNTVFSSRITILGKPGSGKSFTVADFVEELGRFDASLIIFDSKPEYGPLCDYPYLSRPFRAGAHNVTLQKAYTFGTWIMRERAQVVLDLASYRDDTAAAKVMIQILAAFYAWQEKIPNDERIPCTIVLDEAHEWLPQNENMSTVSRKPGPDKEPSILAQLQQAFFSLLKGGRSFGLGCILATQRPADIDNRAIAFGDWRILLNADLPADLKIYRSFGMEEGLAPTLAPGQAWVKGPGDIKGVYKFRERYSPNDSKTPGVEALKKASSVYGKTGPVNTESPVYDPVYTPVNGSESQIEAVTEDPRLRLQETAVNGSSEPETPPSETVNVNAETRKIIHRMVAMGLNHRDISKVVGLNGRHYHIYKVVCAEEGIEIEKEA